MFVDFIFEVYEDGVQMVWVGEMELMYGLQVMIGFILRFDWAVLEIVSCVYNGNVMLCYFLWWVNLVVKGGEGYQSVFLLDVMVVFDYGKWVVFVFFIVIGIYYKVDYFVGVDIFCYKNVFVLILYMVEKLQYDFVGVWCYDEDGGLLYVVNYYIVLGKKQWSWGYSEFGQVWDKSLIDNNGLYIELMIGIFVDNQFDFIWFDVYEEKCFEQYFLFYYFLGMV